LKIVLIGIGKTDASYIGEGCAEYIRRIGRYVPLEVNFIRPPAVHSKLSGDVLKLAEAGLLLKHIRDDDFVVLLDEKGREFDSVGFSNFIGKKSLTGLKRLVFCIGGAYGFGEEMRLRASESLSLSLLTFSHQMVRLIFLEQLYRAFTILSNEPYHNE
jgi:23S rRNA (pseudouridine1915-N3)-methyltransferase